MGMFRFMPPSEPRDVPRSLLIGIASKCSTHFPTKTVLFPAAYCLSLLSMPHCLLLVTCSIASCFAADGEHTDFDFDVEWTSTDWSVPCDHFEASNLHRVMALYKYPNSSRPSGPPSCPPTVHPTESPTLRPTPNPTTKPTAKRTKKPTNDPTPSDDILLTQYIQRHQFQSGRIKLYTWTPPTDCNVHNVQMAKLEMELVSKQRHDLIVMKYADKWTSDSKPTSNRNLQRLVPYCSDIDAAFDIWREFANAVIQDAVTNISNVDVSWLVNALAVFRRVEESVFLHIYDVLHAKYVMHANGTEMQTLFMRLLSDAHQSRKHKFMLMFPARMWMEDSVIALLIDFFYDAMRAFAELKINSLLWIIRHSRWSQDALRFGDLDKKLFVVELHKKQFAASLEDTVRNLRLLHLHKVPVTTDSATSSSEFHRACVYLCCFKMNMDVANIIYDHKFVHGIGDRDISVLFMANQSRGLYNVFVRLLHGMVNQHCDGLLLVRDHSSKAGKLKNVDHYSTELDIGFDAFVRFPFSLNIVLYLIFTQKTFGSQFLELAA